MPVHTEPAPSDARSFVVCDKRPDINRVPIASEQLIQWRCDADVVCNFVASSLGLRRSYQTSANANHWNIGMASGEKRSQMLGLLADGDLRIVVGDLSTPLGELVNFEGGTYSIDNFPICKFVDAASTADKRYTPSQGKRESRKGVTQAKHKDWQRAYRELRKLHPSKSDVWCSQQIAKQEIGVRHSAETIRKNMKA